MNDDGGPGRGDANEDEKGHRDLLDGRMGFLVRDEARSGGVRSEHSEGRDVGQDRKMRRIAMADKAYHIPHGTEANKTVCGRSIEVGGRPQVLLTTDPYKKKGTVCGRCKALKAGQARSEKVTAQHRKIREAAPAEKKERKPGKR